MKITHISLTGLTLLIGWYAVKTLHDAPTAVSVSSSYVYDTVLPAVEGWYFRAISGYPAAVSFEPLVLFRNGEYYEVGQEPLESVNVQQSKASRITAWGTWQKKGETYYLTDSKGKSHDYKLGSGNWFPAYPYSGAVKLKKVYERVSGGDYGNGTSSMAVSKIAFLDNTHFSQGLNAGISTPNAAGGKTNSTSGTYKLYSNTLELTYADGKVVKKSFALGATGEPAKPTADLIFIGGYAYTDE